MRLLRFVIPLAVGLLACEEHRGQQASVSSNVANFGTQDGAHEPFITEALVSGNAVTVARTEKLPLVWWDAETGNFEAQESSCNLTEGLTVQYDASQNMTLTEKSGSLTATADIAFDVIRLGKVRGYWFVMEFAVGNRDTLQLRAGDSVELLFEHGGLAILRDDAGDVYAVREFSVFKDGRPLPIELDPPKLSDYIFVDCSTATTEATGWFELRKALESGVLEANWAG